MFFEHAKIGIWGLGIVGTSAIHFFSRYHCILTLLEKKTLLPEDMHFLSQYSVSVHADSIESFLQNNDYILASPGIDLRPYLAYQHKFITELDIFIDQYRNPIIAITGSVGKTSITHLLSLILTHAKKKTITGGNIGTGMLDLLTNPHNDCAILEVSSFQLEHCRSFAPDLAIWTNLYANHLDRHGSFENYFLAKLKLIKNQNDTQQALVPLELADQLRAALPGRSFNFFSDQSFSTEKLTSSDTLFYFDDKNIVKYYQNSRQIIVSVACLPQITYTINWLILIAAMHLLDLNISLETIEYTLPSHRLEKVATINNIHFYDDSKATIPQSTLAAVQQLRHTSLMLFLGGVSKGVDRSLLIAQLPKAIKHVFCFGKEADQLYQWCLSNNLSASSHQTLKEAFATCIAQACDNDYVLFSPAGASFDLFSNYQERGNQFKKLVHELST